MSEKFELDIEMKSPVIYNAPPLDFAVLLIKLEPLIIPPLLTQEIAPPLLAGAVFSVKLQLLTLPESPYQ